MNFSDIKAIQQIADSNIDPRAALVQQAGDRILQEYHGSLMFPLVATLGGAGYCLAVLASPPLAIAVGLLGGWHMVDKIQRGERAFDDIENGRIERYLNEAQRKVLKQLPPLEEPTTYALPAAQAVDVAASPVGSGLSPNLAAYPDLKERMGVLIQAMTESGFPLGSLLNHPFVWCWGRSQSGKSTLALLLGLMRMVLGGKCSYYTTDNDYPRQFPWNDVADSPDDYSTALELVREIISTSDKGALRGQSWIFDEMFAAYAEHNLPIQPLLTCVLMKLSKTRGGVIGISQADTSSAHGLKGIDAAWRTERVSIEALHTENEMGDRYPTGQYRVDRGGSVEEWQIPAWMLTEQNEWGQADPVVWLLKQFPEVALAPVEDSCQVAAAPVAQPAQPAPQLQQQVEPANPFQLTPEILERLYQASPAEVEPAPVEDEETDLDATALAGLPKELRAIAIFAHRRGDWVTAREARSGIRLLKSTQITTEMIRGFFGQLAGQGIGCVDGEGETLRYRC